MTVSTDFCGGNAVIVSLADQGREAQVNFTQDIRDSMQKWFYWAFCVRGAQGKTVRFSMTDRYIGYFGAAVSRDLIRWEWSDTASEDRRSFTYTFGEDEDCVYFAHDMLYHPSQFYLFAEKTGLSVRILCEDKDGTPIPYVIVGEGRDTVLLTARHHCCESTGNYIMEGIIDEYIRDPMPDTRLIAVPFVDAAGVCAGDQGKDRAPHDHNRDYKEGIYPGVRAVKKFAESEHIISAFDLHSPWHIGGENDRVYIVRNDKNKIDRFDRLSRCFMSELTPEAMKYDIKNDIAPETGWNVSKTQSLTCGAFFNSLPDTDLAFSLETTYFGETGNVISQDRMRETGRCFWRAFRRYREEKHG